MSRDKREFSRLCFMFNMSSNQENTKWVKILSKNNRFLSRQTPLNRCFIKLVTLVSHNSVRIRIDFLLEVFIRLDSYSSTFDRLVEHEKSSSCHQRNKQTALPRRNILPRDSAVVIEFREAKDIKQSEQLKKQACSENLTLYLSCCGCWLFRSAIRLKQITQFLQIHLR